MKQPSSNTIAGFSLIETVVVVALVGIVATVGMGLHTGITKAGRTNKLRADIQTVNSAIEIYRANGGNLQELADPQEILNFLKTRRTEEDASRFVGFSGSTVDSRLAVRMVDEDSSEPRAVWNSATQKFEFVESGPGVVFYLNDALAEHDFGTEDRESSIYKYNPDGGWIWAYSDRNPAPAEGATEMVLGSASSPSSVPAASPNTTSQLSSPVISPPGGVFSSSDFPINVTLSNPNPAGTSVMVSIDGSAYSPSGGTVIVGQDSSLDAYVTGDPSIWTDSPVVGGTYSLDPATTQQLLPPNISFYDGAGFPSEAAVSVTGFDDDVSSISVVLDNPNSAGSSTIMYRLEPVPGEPGITTGFSTYSGKFLVNEADYPGGFGIRSFSLALDASYEDSVEISAFASDHEGLFGGHLDLDTSDFLTEVESGSTTAHTHDFTGKYNLTAVNFFAIPESSQIEIDEAITADKRFKLIVVNGDLSPGLRIAVSAGGQSFVLPVGSYDDKAIDDLPVYTLGSSGGAVTLDGLSIQMGRDVLMGAGIIPSNTGDVRGNELGKHGEWRNGAFTVQAVEVGADGSDQFTVDAAMSSGGHGSATSGLLWEATLFWHWGGDSYHEEDNHYVPGDISTVIDHLEDK